MALQHVLIYDYVAGIAELRTPYREAHLAAIKAGHDGGRITHAGALGDPPTGGLFVFAPGVEPAEIEAFADADPYVRAGLVTDRRVLPWNVVT